MKKLTAILIFLVVCRTSNAHCIIDPDFHFRIMCNPGTVQFLYSGQIVTSATWFFGDGATATGVNALHTYSSYGIYTVKLVIIAIQEGGLCIDSVKKMITIQALHNSSFVLNNDTTVCKGQSVMLNAASSGGVSNCWYSASGFTSTLRNVSVAPLSTTTYYYSSVRAGANLVTDGNFSSGSSSFFSNYTPAFPNTAEEQYWIGNNSNGWNSSYANCTEHTSGTGNMMMVAGTGFFQTTVWQQTLSVVPHTNYIFSFWVQSLESNYPAAMKFSINGMELTDTFASSNTSCLWTQHYTLWNAGDSNTVIFNISYKNQSGAGHGFAIDDISVAEMIVEQDSVTIYVESPPMLSSSADTAVCESSLVQLYSSGAANYSWSPVTYLNNANIPNPVASPVLSVQYIVSGFNLPGCAASDTINISVIPKPILTISPKDTAICFGDRAQLHVSGGSTYQWSPSSGLTGMDSSDPFVSPGINTIYKVNARGSNGCYAEDSVRISVLSLPVIQISKSGDIDCNTDRVQLNASGGIQFNWSPAQSLDNSSVSNPVAKPFQSTMYSVKVKNQQGCASSDSIEVFVIPGDVNNYYIPNAFTPDNDGLNDCFGIISREGISRFELSVFNRWGVRVFHTADPGDCWNGWFEGRLQPSGIYVYFIRMKSICSGEFIRKGTVALIR